MDSLILIANTLTSCGVAVGCWWVAHQYGQAKPPGRLLAVAFSVFGFVSLLVGLARLVDVGRPEWLALISKGAVIAILVALAARNNQAGKDR